MANKPKPRTAFPARTNAMGYQDGLTKLEWVTTQLAAAHFSNGIIDLQVDEVIKDAKQILEACKAEEQGDTE